MIPRDNMIELTPKNSGAVCVIDLFEAKSLKYAFKKLNWKISEERKIIDNKGKVVMCGICNKELNENEITAFIPGSSKPICQNPECFILALCEMEKQKEKHK